MFHFFRKYHYVPPCPKCGSLRTGRFFYVSTTYQKIERIIAENMRYGELSKIELGFGNELEHNAYCEDCGIQWYANIQELPLTDERIQQEMKKRGITEKDIKNIRDCRKINKRKKKLDKKLAKKQKKLEKDKTKKHSINKSKKTEVQKNINDTEQVIENEIITENNAKNISMENNTNQKHEKPQIKPLVRPFPKRKK